jgi:hypothetical protein
MPFDKNNKKKKKYDKSKEFINKEEINRIFYIYLIENTLNEIKEYYEKNKIYIDINNNNFFTTACINNKLDLVKWLYEMNKTIKIDFDLFNAVILNNLLDIGKYLLTIYDGGDGIYILQNRDHEIFRTICKNRSLNIAK